MGQIDSYMEELFKQGPWTWVVIFIVALYVTAMFGAFLMTAFSPVTIPTFILLCIGTLVAMFIAMFKLIDKYDT
jgi:purine-cytosine permease-like protein